MPISELDSQQVQKDESETLTFKHEKVKKSRKQNHWIQRRQKWEIETHDDKMQTKNKNKCIAQK